MFKRQISIFNLIHQNFFGFATKMRQGATKKTKDSAGKRLGIKTFGGHEVFENQILARQRGFKWKVGENVHFGKDHTLHSSKEGIVTFTRDPWKHKKTISIHVIEQEIPNRTIVPPKPFMYHPELFPDLAKKNANVQPLPIKEKKVNPSRVKKNDFYLVDFLVETQSNLSSKKQRKLKSKQAEVKYNLGEKILDITTEKQDIIEEEKYETVIKPYKYNEKFAKNLINYAKIKRTIKANEATNCFYIKENFDKSLEHTDRLIVPNTDFYRNLNQILYEKRTSEVHRENPDEDVNLSEDELGEGLFKQDRGETKWLDERNIGFKEVLKIMSATNAVKFSPEIEKFIVKLNEEDDNKEELNIAKMQNLLKDKKSLKEIMEAFKEDGKITEDQLLLIKELEKKEKNLKEEKKAEDETDKEDNNSKVKIKEKR